MQIQLSRNLIAVFLICSPGYNRCDISEDETTAALRALYKIPAPQNQHNIQAQANGTMASAATTTAHSLNQNHHNFSSDPTKKPKLQKSAVSASYPLHTKSQMQMPLTDSEHGGMKDVKLPLARGNFSNQIDRQHPSNSASGLAKLNKRKGEHLTGGIPTI